MKREMNIRVRRGLFSFCRGFGMNALESKFQRDLIKELESMFKDCLVMKLDANQRQGIPDLLVLYKDKWATLECKRDAGSSKRPNQSYYVQRMNNMSFSRIIFPENKEEVLNELRKAFESKGKARLPKCK